MSVYERVQATGSWDIQFASEVPPSIRSHLLPFSTVYIYPVRGYINRISDATVTANALYGGVLLEPPGSDGKMAGASLAWWMGDADNKGSVIEGPISGSSASLSTWIGSLRPPQLSAGTVTSPGGSLTWSYEWVTRRQAVDSVCAHFGVEWRVNPDRTLDVATAATLYGSTPVAMTSTRGGSSNDLTLFGLGSGVSVSFNYADFASRVIVSGPGGRAAAGSASSYYGPDGATATLWRVVDSSDTPPGSEGTVATNLTNLWSSAGFQRDIKITSPRRDLPLIMPVGSNFYLYAPEYGLVDTANVVRYEASQTFPVTMRAMGIRWPIVDSFGVFLRYWNGSSFSYDDLSDFVTYESDVAEIEIG